MRLPPAGIGGLFLFRHRLAPGMVGIGILQPHRSPGSGSGGVMNLSVRSVSTDLDLLERGEGSRGSGLRADVVAELPELDEGTVAGVERCSPVEEG